MRFTISAVIRAPDHTRAEYEAAYQEGIDRCGWPTLEDVMQGVWGQDVAAPLCITADMRRDASGGPAEADPQDDRVCRQSLQVFGTTSSGTKPACNSWMHRQGLPAKQS